jgi:hypothetical protein
MPEVAVLRVALVEVLLRDPSSLDQLAEFVSNYFNVPVPTFSQPPGMV